MPEPVYLQQRSTCNARDAKSPTATVRVLQAIGEPLDLIEYDTWNVLLPEGEFLTRVGAANFEPVLQQARPAPGSPHMNRYSSHAQSGHCGSLWLTSVPMKLGSN